METKFTKGEWKINHWETGKSGITYHIKDGNISYFSGDAVTRPHFNIVSPISYNEHNIEGSFEGAHIAEINDHSEESKANAKLIATAPKMYEQLLSIVDGSAFDKESGLIWEHRLNAIQEVLKEATD